MTISVSKHSVDDTPKAPTRWAVFAQFVATLFNPSFTQRILTPQFLSMIYGLLMVTVTLGMAYGVLLAAQQSWLWGGLAVILMPIGLLAAIAVIRLLFEVVVLFSRLIVDIHAVAAMQQPLAQIAQMSEPLSEIALGVRDMNTDIKTIAQMYSSIHRISSVTDNLETIAGMYC